MARFFIQGTIDSWLVMEGMTVVGYIIEYRSGSYSEYPFYALGRTSDGELISDMFSSLDDAQSYFL